MGHCFKDATPEENSELNGNVDDLKKDIQEAANVFKTLDTDVNGVTLKSTCFEELLAVQEKAFDEALHFLRLLLLVVSASPSHPDPINN